MKIQLKKVPKNCIVIEGFPGFGLVGTIATEFLIKHLNARPIGRIQSDELIPVAAIHNGEVVEPLGIFYDSKNNIMVIHALSGVRGLEWKIADAVNQLCKQVKCKELISLEGVGSQEGTLRTFYYTADKKKAKNLEKIGLEPLKDGLVLGVTGALMLKNKSMSCIFVESTIGLADSKAAAKIIEVLDKYLGLNVDYKPLMEAAEKFEKTLKTLMEKGKETVKKEEREDLSYVG